jgi:hypothetical protein
VASFSKDTWKVKDSPMSAFTGPASGKKAATGSGSPFGEEVGVGVEVGFGVGARVGAGVWLGVGVGGGGGEHEVTISRVSPKPASNLLARIGIGRLDPVVPLLRTSLASMILKLMAAFSSRKAIIGSRVFLSS